MHDLINDFCNKLSTPDDIMDEIDLLLRKNHFFKVYEDHISFNNYNTNINGNIVNQSKIFFMGDGETYSIGLNKKLSFEDLQGLIKNYSSSSKIDFMPYVRDNFSYNVLDESSIQSIKTK